MGLLRVLRVRHTHLGHEPVGTRVLFIFKDDVCIIIGSQFFEALGAARYFALWSPAGPESLLGDIRAELLVGERDELLRESPLADSPPRAAALQSRCEEEDQGTQRGGE